MRKLFYAFFLVIIVTSCQARSQPALKDGDILFIVSTSGQGKAIQLATKSKFTHVGIVFYENGKPMVYHAVQPVKVSTLEDFLAYSGDGKYEVKRLKDQGRLTAETVGKMKAEAKSKVGTDYDIYFAWDDKELYCSEYVWKIYKKYLSLEIGELRPLKGFDLSSPVVQQIMKRRYGNNIPYEEKMISPGDMYSSGLLE
jgi:uncharacterized protein YycO